MNESVGSAWSQTTIFFNKKADLEFMYYGKGISSCCVPYHLTIAFNCYLIKYRRYLSNITKYLNVKKKSKSSTKKKIFSILNVFKLHY